MNVNPDLIIDLDLSKGAPCERCPKTTPPTIHKWNADLCTTHKDNKGNVIEPSLTYEERMKRTIARFKAGFFASVDPTIPKPARVSQSAPQAAASATSTLKKLTAISE